MPTVAVHNTAGEQVGELELSAKVFGAPVNVGLLHQAVRMYQARQRRGTAATKVRSLVSGGGRKPWRQKGTGRARHGSTRSPIWVGGGVVFGPQPRDYGFTMPKKQRRQALRSALSAKVNDGELIVLDQLQLDRPQTKAMHGILKNLGAEDSALIVTVDDSKNVYLSARNIPKVESIAAKDLNVLAVLRYKQVVMTKEAVAVVEEVLA
ncbi:MAG: 50S ribosomal protein L4 [Limnochordia bacterium]